MTPLIKQTIMSQYANSPAIMSLVESLTDAIDPSKDINLFYDMVFNLHTAQGFGLDAWGRIVNVPRQMNFPDPQGEYFGFADGFYPFNQRPFYAGTSTAYDLPDNAYRSLILIKAMANILRATAPNINKLLKSVFGGKKSYFLLVGHMKARYVFEFSLSSFERFIVYESGILPTPCGVDLEYLDAIPPETFGFARTGFQPFNQGTFYGGQL